MNLTTPNYSNAALGTDQRSNDLLNASKALLNSTPGIQSTVPNNLPVSTTINAGTIANNNPVNIPNLNVPNTTNNLSLSTTNTLSKANSDATATPPTATTSSTKDLLSQAMQQYTTGISTQASDISKINSDAQLLDKKKAATELANSITQYDKEYRDQVKQLKETFQGTTGGLQSELNALQDKYQNTRANMALSYNVANNDYQGAQEIAQQKIQSLKDTNAAYLETYKLQADAIRNNLSDTESKQLDSQIRMKENNDKAIADAYSTVIQNAAQNRAPASILNAIDVASKKPGATIASINAAAGNYGVDIEKQARIDNINSEIAKRKAENKPVFLDVEGKVVVDRTEAQKISKELVNNDAYKAIQKSKDSLAYLKNFKEAFDKYGSTSAVFDPVKNSELKSKYNAATLQLKEFFNLGVLNGPDLSIIQGVLPNPTDTSNLRKAVQLGTYQPGTATKSGLDSMYKMVETTLDDRYKSIKTQYNAYSPQAVAGLADANRIYIEQKSFLNPSIKALVDENPNLSDEEIISIMGI